MTSTSGPPNPVPKIARMGCPPAALPEQEPTFVEAFVKLSSQAWNAAGRTSETSSDKLRTRGVTDTMRLDGSCASSCSARLNRSVLGAGLPTPAETADR